MPSTLAVRLLVVLCVIAAAAAEFVNPSIWPQPNVFTYGTSTTPVSRFVFDSPKVNTLLQAYQRYDDLIFNHKTADNALSNRTTVSVSVKSLSEDYPQVDTDESYALAVSTSGAITIKANTVYGALRALESLSQLVLFDFDTESYAIAGTPLSVQDAPRFQHRGLLLDTSRHYQPVPELKRTIDALSYSKYNVLHWHIVDTQSFPFQSLTYPKLWNGAYTKPERYTQEDVKELVEYGRLRGVKIMIEFDMPGHASAWCTGYPDICPSVNCREPLDPSNEFTFTLIDSLLGECTGRSQAGGLFPYQLLHLGGDEVEYRCWELSDHIQDWQAANDLNGSEDTYEYFVNRAATIARSQQRTPVQWVEVFEHFTNKLDNNTIVHVWKEKSTMNAVLQAGYRALLSDNDRWYLDWLEVTWDQMYNNEPTDGLSADANPSLILGGESCMWGETVDPSDLDATIWPRAAAVAERLWTSQDVIESMTAVDMSAVESRLETFRCLLNQRGVGAAPVTNTHARYAPLEPGSCYVQRRRLDEN